VPSEESPGASGSDFPRIHVIEPASSGRAKCRGCGQKIEKGALRFGEKLENPFADGEMTHWFHLDCAAFKRPEPLLQTLERREQQPPENWEWLESEAKKGLEHRRLPRVNGAERATSGRATCRSCRETIAKGSWRIPLVYWEEGRFEASGFIHARCARGYFETIDILPRVRRFAPDLSEEELEELQAGMESGRDDSAAGEDA
jgi:hypothetical protein